MLLLLLASFIFAFSFGLLKRLTGLDSSFIAAVRLGLALLVFLPFFRPKGLTVRLVLTFAAIGAIQFGLTYLAYIESFQYLQAHQVALFTLTTPILVTLLADALDRILRLRALYAAMLAVLGTACITVKSTALGGTLTGLILVQLSNAAFAIGQVWYRRVRARHPAFHDRDIFALLFAGALVVTLPVALPHLATAVSLVTPAQTGILLYLGIIASGVGFFLWNFGATRVSAGTLAVMNNAKIPLAVACSLLFFGESADLPRLLLGGGLMVMAVLLAERRGPT
jgi:drug/metabolite transporter (DMT)-like permease